MIKQKISDVVVNVVMPFITTAHTLLKPKRHRRIPILYYHSVDDRDLSIPIDIFREQMRYLHRKGFKTISLDELIEFIKFGVKLSSKPIVITFDDCFESVYLNAYPILKKFGFTATFFITTGYVGTVRWGSPLTQRWIDDKKSGTIPFKMVSWNQIKDLSDSGMSIGAHTCSHRNLTEITHEKAKEEICKSKEILEERLHIPISTFSYPRGLFDEKIMEIVKECGFKGACSTFGGVGSKDTGTLYALKRYPVGNFQGGFIALAEGLGDLYLSLVKYYQKLHKDKNHV